MRKLILILISVFYLQSGYSAMRECHAFADGKMLAVKLSGVTADSYIRKNNPNSKNYDTRVSLSFAQYYQLLPQKYSLASEKGLIRIIAFKDRQQFAKKMRFIIDKKIIIDAPVENDAAESIGILSKELKNKLLGAKQVTIEIEYVSAPEVVERGVLLPNELSQLQELLRINTVGPDTVNNVCPLR